MEAFPLRAVAHDERLTLTEHLSELRARLLLSVAVLAVLFAGCLWQSRSLLHVLNAPLAQLRNSSPAQGAGSELPEGAGAQRRRIHPARARLLPSPSRPAGRAERGPFPRRRQPVARAASTRARRSRSGSASPSRHRSRSPSPSRCSSDCRSCSLRRGPSPPRRSLPPSGVRCARSSPLAPALFAGGVAFAYFLVLPPAVRFLQGFNHGAFDVLVQARTYYRFELMTMLCLGAIFEIPVLLLALGRVGILSSTTLRRHRRYAIVGLSVLAGLLPGTDPVTTLLETLPLFALYEATIVVLRFNERRRGRRQVPPE